MKKVNKMFFIFLFTQLEFILVKSNVQLQNRLLQLDAQIKSLQKINSIYFNAKQDFLHLYQQKILENQNFIQKQIIKQSPTYQKQNKFKLTQNYCGIEGFNLSKVMIKTSQNIFVGINRNNINQFNIYSTDCKLIKVIHNLQIQLILSSRSYLESIYFISKDNNLCCFQESNVNTFQHFRVLTKLDYPIAGGFVRSKDSIKSEIFIIFENGNIKKYDQMGTLQLTIVNQEDQFLKNKKQKNVQVVDKYPHPLILQNEWIYIIDTSKHLKQISDCPYIPDIKKLYVDSLYSPIVYVLTKNAIFLLELKGSKKSCQINQVYPIDSKLQQNNFVLYKNVFFMSNIFFNLSTMQFGSLKCENFSLQHAINQKGKKKQQSIAINQCCEKEKCLIGVSTQSKIQQSNYIFLWIVIGFLAIMILAFKFLRRSSSFCLPIDEKQQKKYNEIQEQIKNIAQPIKKNNKKKK